MRSARANREGNRMYTYEPGAAYVRHVAGWCGDEPGTLCGQLADSSWAWTRPPGTDAVPCSTCERLKPPGRVARHQPGVSIKFRRKETVA